jgi:hypothetical protein
MRFEQERIMKGPMKPRRLLMAALVGSSVLFTSPIIVFASNNAWQPQISEKILMLPTKHLERAVEQDFANSLLANDMNMLDQQIGAEIATITSLQSNQHLYEGEDALEVEHQIIVGKRNYLERMGDQIQLKRQQLETKNRLFQRLMRQSRRDEVRSRDTQQLNLAIDEARERSNAVETKLRDELFFASNLPESKFSENYSENRAAVENLRAAIANHPANEQVVSDGQPITKADQLAQMILGIEAELAMLNMEEEVIGHMAKLLSLDAMSFAEKVAEQAWQDQAGTSGQALLSPKQNVKMFISY